MAFPSITEFYLHCQYLEHIALDTASLSEGLTELIEELGLAEGKPFLVAR